MRTQSGNYFRNQIHLKKTHHRWYVLANRTAAVFYEDLPDQPFLFVDRMKNPKGHLTEGQLDSDRPGSNVSSAGAGTIHHGTDRRFHHHEQVAATFARNIAMKLQTLKSEKKFDELIIVAEPHFLGLLRNELSQEVRSLVSFEVNREYIEGSDLEMRDAILKSISKK